MIDNRIPDISKKNSEDSVWLSKSHDTGITETIEKTVHPKKNHQKYRAFLIGCQSVD